MTPDVEPGYLRDLLPKDAPQHGEKWEDIFRDFETKILPGVTHWQHPRFHAYFPAGNCYPSIIGEMLSAGLGIVGFSWAASPSCTELETIVLDWLGRMISLPKSLLPFGDEAPLQPTTLVGPTSSDSNNNNLLPKSGSNDSAASNHYNHHPPYSPLDPDDDVLFIDKNPSLTGGGVILVSIRKIKTYIYFLCLFSIMFYKILEQHFF